MGAASRRGERGQKAQPLSVRRPHVVLAVAALVLSVLGLMGLRIEGQLKPNSLSVPGTESWRAGEMLRDHFGESAPFAILLQGPSRAIDRQGPSLVRALQRNPKVTTVSPWSQVGPLVQLRPSKNRALILVDFHVAYDIAVSTVVPHLEQILAKRISPPVAARSTSFASVSKAIQEESISATRRSEMIVIPILLVILLLVFRSPVAAAIPLAFGGITVIASRGLMSVAAGYVDLNGFSLSIASMMGLALGVDYALLMVSRFREELVAGMSPADAARVTQSTAGRTTVFAGSTLLVAMLVGALLVPGELVSLCGTVAAVIVIAVAGPWIVGPAILVLLGRNIDRWRIGRPPLKRTRWMAISDMALRHPLLTTAAISLVLLGFAAPALSLTIKPASIEQLPSDDPVRIAAEDVDRAAGAGWANPFIVVAVAHHGTMGEPKRLAAMARWQAHVEKDPDVSGAIGPAQLIDKIMPLRRAGRSLVGRGRGNRTLGTMIDNLGRASDGVARLRRGLAKGTEGAAALANGSERARLGAGLLSVGLSKATSGSAAAQDSLNRFSEGAKLLVGGEQGTLFGIQALIFGEHELEHDAHGVVAKAKRVRRELRNNAAAVPNLQNTVALIEEELQRAWSGLQTMSVGASDPNYTDYEATIAAVRQALTAASGMDPTSAAPTPGGYGLSPELATLYGDFNARAHTAGDIAREAVDIGTNLKALQRLIAHVYEGTTRLKDGSTRLAGGATLISEGAGRLRGGLSRLNRGASRLGGGLASLQAGNFALERGLATAFHRSRPLETGMRRGKRQIKYGQERLRHNSPGIFDSGYFVLSALDGAPPAQRNLASRIIDLRNGGQAAVLLVASNRMGESALLALNDRLKRSAQDLANNIGADVAITGATQIADYDRAAAKHTPLLIITITVMTFFALIVILRALPLAAIAVFLNLVTVAVAFGVVRLFFEVPDGLPFGGTSSVNAIGVAGIFAVVFGLSIDYAVFLLLRMREDWLRNGDSNTAIAYGLERTASVITGAAAIMAVVFLVFATARIATVAQFGIGLTAAILLDATVIRLMLMPSLMQLIGPRVWWLPDLLDKHLPRFNIHRDHPDTPTAGSR